MVDAGPNTAAASLKPVSYEALANWVHDDHFLALDAFRKSAEAFAKARLNFAKHPTFAGQSGDWSEIFADSLHPDAGLNPRGFFEKNFIPVEIIDTHRPDGLFTAEHVTCLAACDKAPLLQCNFHYHESLDLEQMKVLIEQWRADYARNNVPSESQGLP